MSWATVRAALVTRVQAVSGTANVHGYIRNIVKSWQDPEFKEVFMEDVGGNQFRPHTWMFSRTDCSRETCEDDSQKVIVQHTVRLRAVYGLVDSTATENTFQDLVDAVCENLQNGDRTLGGVAITHSLPQASQIGHVEFYTNKFLSHSAIITFIVEEVQTIA